MDVLVSMGFSLEKSRAALVSADQNVERALELLLSGSVAESEVSYDERVSVCSMSQYTFSQFGSSACTPITCIFLSKILPLLDANTGYVDEELMTDSVLTGIQILSTLGGESSTRHWSAEEFVGCQPTLGRTLINLQTGNQLLLSDKDAFRKLFRHARDSADSAGNSNKFVGVIITKPPETVCVCLPPTTFPSQRKRFLMYDSHSRPQLGLDGSYLVDAGDVDYIITRLKGLFPAFVDEDGEDMMGMMYNSFEGSYFVCPSIPVVQGTIIAAAAGGESTRGTGSRSYRDAATSVVPSLASTLAPSLCAPKSHGPTLGAAEASPSLFVKSMDATTASGVDHDITGLHDDDHDDHGDSCDDAVIAADTEQDSAACDASYCEDGFVIVSHDDAEDAVDFESITVPNNAIK